MLPGVMAPSSPLEECRRQDVSMKSEEKMSETDTPHWTQRLQARWGLDSVFQVVMVLVVFALTGMSVLFIKEPLFQILGIDNTTSSGLKTFIYLVSVLPIYQVLLLFYALILGQFRFFWEYEKKSMARMAKLFRRKSQK